MSEPGETGAERAGARARDWLAWVQYICIAASIAFGIIAAYTSPRQNQAWNLKESTVVQGPVTWGTFPVDWRLVPSPVSSDGRLYLETASIKHIGPGYTVWYQYENTPPRVDDDGELVWIVNTQADFDCQLGTYAPSRSIVWGPEKRISDTRIPYRGLRVEEGSLESSVLRVLCDARIDFASLPPRPKE